MRLGYLPTPTYGKSLADGLGKVGGSIAALGQLGADEIKRKKDEEIQNKSFDLQDREVKLREKKLDTDIQIMQDEKADKASRKSASVSVFKTLHPKVSSSLGSDENIYAYIQDIDKYASKNSKMNKLDVRVSPKGNKILTYEVDGEIKEINLGAVKTDWNVKQPSSDIPEGYVSVGKEFYESYADRGMVKSSKDGKFYAPINFVNSMQKEQISGDRENLDTPL